MIHTIELSKILEDYVDETGKLCRAEDKFVELISHLHLERRNKTCYATTRFAEQGFPMIRLYKIKAEVPKQDMFGGQQQTTMYFYMLCLTINPSSMFGGDPHISTNILSFTPDYTKAIYHKIFDLIPCLEYQVERKDLFFRCSLNDCGNCDNNCLELYKQYDKEWSEKNFFRVHRIDFTYDTALTPQQYLTLINRGYTLRKNTYERTYYDDNDGQKESVDGEPAIPDYEDLLDGYHSDVSYIYYKGKSVNINIYHKGTEIEKEKLDFNPERNYDFLRIEVQVKKDKLNAILTKLKKYELDGYSEVQRRELHFLATPEVEEYVLNYYVNKLTGTGLYVPYSLALSIVDGSNHTNREKEKMKAILHEINQRQGIAKMLELVENGTITDLGKLPTVKKYLRMIHELGINPVTIPTRADAPKITLHSTCGNETLKTGMMLSLVDVIKGYAEQTREDRKFGIPISEEDLKNL